jgi:Icc-related predicted phosphoesterase
MLILYSTDLFGDTRKYLRLFALSNHLKPTYTILNGNLFSSKNDNPSNVDEIIKMIKAISINSKVLLQLGGYDTKQMNQKITDLLSTKKIINITNTIYNDLELNIAGINYIPSHLGSHWKMTDGLIHKDILDDNSEVLIRKHLSVCNPLKTIFLTYFPPLGILDYDPDPSLKGCYNIRKLCEGEFSNNVQPLLVLSAAFVRNFQYTKKWFTKVGNCLCIQPSQEESSLYFSLIEIEPSLEITQFYHPNEYISALKKNLNYERIM